MDIRVQAYSFSPTASTGGTSRALAAPAPLRPSTPVSTAQRQVPQNQTPVSVAPPQATSQPRGGIAFTTSPEPGQVVDIYV